MQQHTEASLRLIRIPRVKELTALSNSEIWRRIRAGTFPQPHKLGPQTTVFVEAEIADWVRARISERDATGKPA
jgi:prophage regulatory protein